MNRAKVAGLDGNRIQWLKRHYYSVTRRKLMQFIAAGAAAAKSGWPHPACAANYNEPSSYGSWAAVQPRSMFFSAHSPTVQILCSIGVAGATARIKSVRVNDELVPCLSPATVAGAHWRCDGTDLIIYAEEKALYFNLSRFPHIQALLTEKDKSRSPAHQEA